MSTSPPPPPPPPPPPGSNPVPFGQQPGQVPPGGYPHYGLPPAPQQGTNGLSIASLVLGLVNVIPCFWVVPIPAVLAIIFGFVSRGQMKSLGSDRGKGLAIAGIVLGIVFIVVAVAIWLFIATSDSCYRDGTGFHCSNLDN